jgi:hypothetical protein
MIGKQDLQRYLYDAPYKQRIQNGLYPVPGITAQAFLAQAAGYKYAGSNEEQGHAESEKEHVDVVEYRVVLQIQTGFFDAFKTMPVGYEDDADAPVVIDPPESFVAEYVFGIEKIHVAGLGIWFSKRRNLL